MCRGPGWINKCLTVRVQGLCSLYLKVPFVYLVFILPLSFLLKIWIQLRLIYGCLTWQDACDSVQGALHPHQASQASSVQFLSTLIRAGLSCQEVWQIWCPDKASYISPNLVCMSCCCVSVTSGVGVYPQQEHIQPMLPAWVYNDSLIPGKHFCMNRFRLISNRVTQLII